MKIACSAPNVRGMPPALLPVLSHQVRGVVTCRSSSGEHAETSGRDHYAYNAGASSERQKATIEHVFGGERNDQYKGSNASPPWHMGWQMNERNLVWSNDLKLRLLQRNVAQELGLSDQDAQQRIVDVTALLPGLATRLAAIRASTVVHFCADIKALADRLIHLKAIFPGADAGQILLQQPAYMLSQDLAMIQQSAERLRHLIPGVDIDRLVEEHPTLLDVPAFEQAISDAKHVIPDLDVGHMMRYNPALIFGFQRGSQMIPYDEVPTQAAPKDFV